MRKIIVAIFVITSFLLSSCDTNGGTVDLTVNETNAEVTEITDEIIHMNNCGGKAETEQVVTKSKSVNIEGGGNLGVNAAFVNGEVSAKYGEVVGTSKSIKLAAPLGTNMEFTIRWTEKTWLGFVTSQEQISQASYKVSVPISVELVNNQDLGCSQNSETLPVIPTATQIIAIMPTEIVPTEILPTYIPDPNCMTITMFREMGKDNETKTYVRCPVGQIQYSIQIDDVLNSMILSCPGQPDKNISFSKNQARSDGQLLITVDSEVFRSEQGCKVYLTITNSIAEMGYTVWQEVIAP
jgi:hypothetical protein